MKKKLTIVLFGLLLVVGITGVFWGPQIVQSASFWDSCRKVDELCYYPGLCRSYIDTNDDAICDRSQPEPVEVVLESDPIVVESGDSSIAHDKDIISDDSDAGISTEEIRDTLTESETEKAITSHRSVYYFLPIILPIIILYGITWLASKKRKIPLSLHRKIWNYVLLLPALASCIFGIILTIEIEFGLVVTLPFDIMFWHVEAGIIMGTVVILHIAWHWKYFVKAFRLAQQDK